MRQPSFLGLRPDKTPEECVASSLSHERQPRAERETALKAAEEAARSQRIVHLTNLDKPFWPDDGYTKGDLIEYYRSVAPWLLPYLRDRPLVLTRYPDGIDGKSFFQKNAPEFAPDWVKTKTIWSEHSEREIQYFVCEDEESLLFIAKTMMGWSSFQTPVALHTASRVTSVPVPAGSTAYV